MEITDKDIEELINYYNTNNDFRNYEKYHFDKNNHRDPELVRLEIGFAFFEAFKPQSEESFYKPNQLLNQDYWKIREDIYNRKLDLDFIYLKENKRYDNHDK